MALKTDLPDEICGIPYCVPGIGNFFLLLLVLSLFAAAGCGRGPAAPPNILFISVDTLRRDHLGCYGYERETSPRIDRIAGNGVLFENGVSTSCWTLPSHTSMLTGLYPSFHRLQDDGNRLAGDVATLAEQLRDAGYHTMAVTAHVYVSSEFGLDRGFDRFDDSLIRGGAENPVASEVIDRALDLFRTLPPEPFFAFVHFFDPHWDYAPPPPFDTKFTDPTYDGPIDGTLDSMLPFLQGDRRMPAADLARAVALYDGEIAFVDAQIGRLIDGLDEMGRMENTLIVLTGDHGEEFQDHGRLGHGKSLFREQLGVPIILSGHDTFPAGGRSDRLVSLVDLAPTLLELAGVVPAERLQGVSLAGAEEESGRSVFGESIRFGNEMRTVRDSRYKMIHYLQGDHRQFYDMEKDPGEQRPLSFDPTRGGLTEKLVEYSAEADRGWHMKLIAVSGGSMRCRGTIRTEGRIVAPRRYWSGNTDDGSTVRFHRFELSREENELVFDASIQMMIGEIAFETTPPGAPVLFDVEVTNDAGDAGLFLGHGERTGSAGPFRLLQTDPRLHALPRDYLRVPPGCYIRAVPPRDAPAEKSELSEETIRRLRALGYIEE